VNLIESGLVAERWFCCGRRANRKKKFRDTLTTKEMQNLKKKQILVYVPED
jgi:hypothetical protein